MVSEAPGAQKQLLRKKIGGLNISLAEKCSFGHMERICEFGTNSPHNFIQEKKIGIKFTKQPEEEVLLLPFITFRPVVRVLAWDRGSNSCFQVNTLPTKLLAILR